MYETYSNVEDPDGFYAIKTLDVSQALHRRLIHEGDYWRSFELHGADIEAASIAMCSHAVLAATKDLHRLGLDRVSGLVLDNLRKQGISLHEAQALTFDLAWRTGDWNLPPSTSAASTTQSLLYSALRAVHRERDLARAREVVFEAVSQEAIRLKALGVQRITQVQRTVTDLLCLREIHNWLDPKVQSTLDGNDGDLSQWEKIDSGFS